jgi:hypothetical protein
MPRTPGHTKQNQRYQPALLYRIGASGCAGQALLHLFSRVSPSPADPEGGKPVSASGDDPSRKIM